MAERNINEVTRHHLQLAYNGLCGVITDAKKAGALDLARHADVIRRDIADRQFPGQHHPLSGDLEWTDHA
jgi:hypothetical protein